MSRAAAQANADSEPSAMKALDDRGHNRPIGKLKIDMTAIRQARMQTEQRDDCCQRIVSDGEEDSVMTPLDYRMDWSKETRGIRRWLGTCPGPLIITTDSPKDEANSSQEESIDCDMDSVLSCDDFSDINIAEDLDSIWE
eukprot:CAMPEP_0183317904 /NCGR_PEP_ID=MMETSP0160_2-20130417/59228_1 /TAXON_ID=2839 ORGANISM="Odontella Sinensis, Strain Grunow 1884" /NCGR_SAMPLE_ID=MMETSP0160_2 /ASSEMBLY_ACC=CAM_ASM_000250 /LENGTH=139 /DNA_ID=CAMNT_0025484039 /DNA_START=11 /DNA_END=427 /DNA_ORIENTATION=+